MCALMRVGYVYVCLWAVQRMHVCACVGYVCACIHVRGVHVCMHVWVMCVHMGTCVHCMCEGGMRACVCVGYVRARACVCRTRACAWGGCACVWGRVPRVSRLKMRPTPRCVSSASQAPSQLGSLGKGAASGEDQPKTKGSKGGTRRAGSGGGGRVGLAGPSLLGSKLLFAAQLEMGCNTSVLWGHFPWEGTV